MPSMVYLIGSEVPVWVTEAPDKFIGRLEDLPPDRMAAVTAITADDGDESYYSEHTAYLRPDQVSYVTVLSPRLRELLEEVRGR